MAWHRGRSATGSGRAARGPKGDLMERFAVGADDAFVLLRKLSEERNVPLRRIAGARGRRGR
ncbi:hypothetical protein CEJ39_06805 [Rhodococcus pyridinivorans]|nr:hypothetical protein CEJ39_06805 [Rhodococcus pyridinivorans]